MKKLLASGIMATVLFTGCAGTQGTNINKKVQTKLQEKTTSTILGKVGLSSIAPKKRTNTDRIVDIATGKSTTSIEEAGQKLKTQGIYFFLS